MFDRLKATLGKDQTRHALGNGAKAIVIIALVIILLTLFQGMDGAFATIGFPILFVLAAFAFLILRGKRPEKDDGETDPIHRKDARRDKMNKRPVQSTDDDRDNVERRPVRIDDDINDKPVRHRQSEPIHDEGDIEERLQSFRERMMRDE